MAATTFSARALLLASAFCAPLPALADFSPDALWQSWQDRAAQSGHDLGATVEQGGALTLRGLTLGRDLGKGRVTARFDRLDLTQDGADVRITVPGSQQVTLVSDPAEGDTTTAVFALGDAPLIVTARGELEDPSYGLSGDILSATLVSLQEGDAPVDAEVQIDLTGLGGTLAGLAGRGAPLSADLTADTLATEIAVRDPASGTEVYNTATQSDMTLNAELTGTGDDWTLTAKIAGAASDTVSLQSGPQGSIETESSQESSRLSLTLTDLRADLSAALTGLATTVTGPMFGAGPVSLAMKAADLAVSVPTAVDTATQIARINLGLADVTMGDTLWSMLDPSGAIPRDPAQLRLTAEADVDVTEDNMMAKTPTAADMPGVLPRGLRIDNFDLALGGARMQGTGDLTIPEGPGGIPDIGAPIGEINLQAQGIMGLLQKAMAAGMMTMEQAMGAQMMIGMLTTPGDGDSFTTRIEGKPGGAIFVNGNQMR